MAGRKKTGGRKVGSLNKVTVSVKAVLEEAFDKLGGTDAMVAWAMENPTEFYKLYAKLLPVQVNADVQVSEVLAERLNRAKERLTNSTISKGQ